MMKFIGIRLPRTMIKDLNYLSEITGTSKSQFIRQGILGVIADYYRNEAIRQKNQEKYENNKNVSRRGGGDWISITDGW